MRDTLVAYTQGYSATKHSLGEMIGVGDDLLDLHVGLAMFVITALLLRRPMRSPWPLAAVAPFALANDIVDYAEPDLWSAARSALEIDNTVFWPRVLFLLARRGGGVGTEV